MAYVVPIHRPNSVRHALRAQLFPDQDECLVLAKTNRLEFWKIDHEAGTLVYFDSKVISGIISMLQKLRPRDSVTDLLFIGTDRFQYFTLGWDSETHTFGTLDSYYDIHEKHMRDSQSQDRCVVDPTGRYSVVLIWEGVLNILRLKPRKSRSRELDWMDQVRISELFIKSLTFLHVETGQPKIAFLYQTNSNRPDSQLVTYKLYSDDKNTQVSRFETRDQVDRFPVKDPGAAILIPVGRGDNDHKRYIIRNAAQARAQLGGLLIVGETRLLYYDDAAKVTVETALKEASIFVAWAEYDVSHYFVGDDYGTLWLLEIQLDSGAVVTGMEMTKIGTTSRANSLVYMGNGLLFVGSHFGDSQVFHVFPQHGWHIQQVQDIPNISPILDFTIMDMGNREGEEQSTNEYSSGQARIVTGSGVFKDGSLRSVRSGVGLEDVGILADLDDIRSLFPIRSKISSGANGKPDTLLASFLLETRVFLFDPMGNIEEVESFKGLSLNEQTLIAQNLPNNRLLQATPTRVHLIDLNDGVAVSTWKPTEGKLITSASANDEWVMLSVDGKVLFSLQVREDLVEVQRNESKDDDQVACIHLPPQYPHIGVVGFWKSGNVSIVDIETLQPLHSESLRRKDDKTSVPRDLALAQIQSPETNGPTLFVSMEDGLIVSFNVSSEDFSLSGRKSVVLGTRYAKLQLLPQENGIFNVFSASEHPSLIYASDGRIVYSAVTADDAVCVCAFDTDAFPDSIVVATEDTLKICSLDRERRTHVQSLPMGHTVRRIAYSRNEQVFALGCIKREVVDNEELITSSIKLVDEVIFGQIGKSFALGGYSGVEMVEAIIRAELPDSYGNRAERFIVGTSLQGPVTGKDQVNGRIIVLGIDSERNLYQVTQHELKGSCHCLDIMDDHIVAGLNKTVVVYRYTELTTSSAKLERLASYRPSTVPIDLVVDGDIIGVADVMKSMTLVKFSPAAGEKRASLQEIARHHHAVWATSIAHIEGSSWLEADANGNLIVLSPNKEGVTDEDKKRMEITSEMNLGEMVNKIRTVTVDSSENAPVVPRAFLGTVEGGIYLFGTINSHYQDLLFRFQNNVAQHIGAVGGLKFDKYRAFRNEAREGTGPFRFIDGELIERFLDVDEQTQEAICSGLGPDVEAMRNLVEELKRLH